ncbi:MAG: hypothetical protein PW789_00870 [Edaphobacter sp.]|uniref:hypothetical protein n=1 Tax=Edaphobacter sp. TaxID=1934404 RepID=UPI00238650E3|nr:hypothetical protein [Edaphobacter sp.]MDE1175141.1 hypothetical protein [Edaphobacter sp.]
MTVRQMLMVSAATLFLSALGTGAAFQGGHERAKVVLTRSIELPGTVIQVDFGEGRFDVGDEVILRHVEGAAEAVATYFGRFPVARARVLILPEGGRGGVSQGTTWGHRGGMQGFTRIRVGEKVTPGELKDDWMMTHELVHMAFPDVAEEHHWIEEGMATYVEPIARVQAGQLEAKTIWRDMMEGMPKGEPEPGDEGLDHTHTWGRTYWGGGLFCLVADTEIRKQTHNRKGLQDALRAVVDAGGSIDQEWPLERVFAVGDQATGTHVLSTMYKRWSVEPVPVDLAALWGQLGVRRSGDDVEFDAKAPLAKVREAITRRVAGTGHRLVHEN